MIDNISRLLGGDLKQLILPGARLKISVSCFEPPRNSLKIRGLRSD